jgi:hypothetical protein
MIFSADQLVVCDLGFFFFQKKKNGERERERVLIAVGGYFRLNKT